MASVGVKRAMQVSRTAAFDVLTDHARYERFRGIRSSALIREGDTDRNGLGAVREVRIGPCLLREEIVGWDPPRGFDYVIREINGPFEHQGGSLRFAERQGGCEVAWNSAFEVTSRLAGPLQERVWRFGLSRGFARALADAERIARSG